MTMRLRLMRAGGDLMIMRPLLVTDCPWVCAVTTIEYEPSARDDMGRDALR